MDDASLARSAHPITPSDTRECRICLGTGAVVEFVDYDDESGELAQAHFACFICKGSGTVYLYPRRR